MPCTTLLVGRMASNDGSTIIARNDDAGSFHYTPKKVTVVPARKEPTVYKSVLSGVEIPMPGDAMSHTAAPNAVEGKGIWAASGINEANVSMTATETITSNPRVLGADPLAAGGIGEEDIVLLVLPYIRSARQGVLRLGSLLEEYGTYEMNGIAFQDEQEIWWLETIGGHHWMARRVPDEGVVVMPNQLGIDGLDLTDTQGKNNLFSKDLPEFIAENALDLTMDGPFDPRLAFGSHEDSDHVYNTPRGWYMLRYLLPHSFTWEGPDADYRPEDDDLPWCVRPERKVTVEDIKYLLSSHYQGTPYDPYGSYGDQSLRGKYRPIGINRTDLLSINCIRPGKPADCAAVQWLCFGSNAFNVALPIYSQVPQVPEYLSCTGPHADTGSFYWVSRLIAALADGSYKGSLIHIERYQLSAAAEARRILNHYDGLLGAQEDPDKRLALRLQANQELADTIRRLSQEVLDKVLYERSNVMKNAYARSDA